MLSINVQIKIKNIPLQQLPINLNPNIKKSRKMTNNSEIMINPRNL